jgi:hypothetical protein
MVKSFSMSVMDWTAVKLAISGTYIEDSVIFIRLLLRTVDSVKAIHDVDVNQTGADAPPAAYASQSPELFVQPLSLAEEAVSLAGGPCLPKVFTGRNPGELVELARIPNPDAIRLRQI